MKVTHAITATNDSIIDVPSIENKTDLPKLSEKHNKYPLQNTQKKKIIDETQKVAWQIAIHAHQSLTHVQYHGGMWGWHLKKKK